MTHTATPWVVELDHITDDFVIAKEAFEVCRIAQCFDPETAKENRANAAHIVKCVNLHEELVGALSDLMKSCENWAPTIDRSRARTALAKAKGGSHAHD